jgi:hypothetical protein
VGVAFNKGGEGGGWVRDSHGRRGEHVSHATGQVARAIG